MNPKKPSPSPDGDEFEGREPFDDGIDETDEIDIGALRLSGGVRGDSEVDLDDGEEDWGDLSPDGQELLIEKFKQTATDEGSVGLAPEDREDEGEWSAVSQAREALGPSSFPLQQLLTLDAQVESVIFASPKPLKVGDILEIIGGDDVAAKEVQDAINRLLVFYEERGGGFKLEHVRGGGYQFRTVPAAAPLMERIFASRPRPLSRAAQETLAIIAYRQPATRADIEFIRGVDAGSIIKNLLERDLIKCVGRKEDSGRPMVFGTTDEFLRVYQLESLKDLPPLDSFQPAPEMLSAVQGKLTDDAEVDVDEFLDDRDDFDEDDAPSDLSGWPASDGDDSGADIEK